MCRPENLVDLEKHPPVWLSYPETQNLFAAIEKAGGQCRFVGGCVRDALLGIVSDDLDLCTDLLPEKALEILEDAGFRVIPTGIRHGTITAVMGARVFEITTLRIDVRTDGRHADVAFTTNWKEDASRRDFTFNALFLDKNGRLSDYFSGLSDLKEGIVRFIGDAGERICEDYLRILRYFRFLARFGNAEPEEGALEAIRRHRDGLKSLSSERLLKEISLLLKTKDPVAAIRVMQQQGLFMSLFGRDLDPRILENSLQLDFQYGEINRFSFFISGDAGFADLISRQLRMSSKMRARLLAACEEALPADLTDKEIKERLYFWGRETFDDRVKLAWARSPLETDYGGYLKVSESWDIPVFPLQGRDLIEVGIPPGPDIGNILERLERRWVESDFLPDREALLSDVRSGT